VHFRRRRNRPARTPRAEVRTDERSGIPDEPAGDPGCLMGPTVRGDSEIARAEVAIGWITGGAARVGAS
jgi:hypothetical protein